MPKVSVVIPCGRGHFSLLPKAIKSIITQTYRDWEIIVAYDGFQGPRYYPRGRIRYYDLDYLGVAHKVRRFCIEAADGEYITIQDADDLSVSNRLEMQFNFLESANARLCYGNMMAFRGKSLCLVDPPHLSYKGISKANKIPWPTVMCEKSLLLQYPLDENLKSGADWLFFAQIAKARVPVGKIDEVLVYYNQDTSLVTKHFPIYRKLWRMNRNRKLRKIIENL